MEKKDTKNLNWKVPPEVAEAFDKQVTSRWGMKGKWIGAVAAMLMYFDATEEEREEYGALASSMTGKVVPENVKAKLSKAVKATPKKGPKS